MPTFVSDAIVLRHYQLGDADRLIVLLTRAYGKLRGVAAGARKPKGHLGGTLEPFNHVRVELWRREGKDLGQIRGAELLDSFPGKNADFAYLCAASYFAEIVGELLQENQPNQSLFRLLLAALRAMTPARPTPALVRYFEIWALRLNGLLPDFSRCARCGKRFSDELLRVLVESGEARCAACADRAGLPLGVKSAKLLEKMMKVAPEEIMIVPFGEESGVELAQLTERLLYFHLERQLKSWPALREELHS